MADSPWFGVLVDKETGAELHFSDRGDYNATFYAGGYREKKFDETPRRAAPAEPQPRVTAPQPSPRSTSET